MFLRRFLAFTFVLISFTALAQSQDDTGDYLNLLQELPALSLEQKMDRFSRYLQDNPDSLYRTEIENNLEALSQLLSLGDANKSNHKKDAELYLKATQYSKKLTLKDQVQLWKQFLNENPNTVYKDEVTSRIQFLEKRLGSKVADTPPTSQPSTSQNKPVVSDRRNKDPQTALILATLPGLAIPGMGHWYTRDYVVAGLLSALRIGGLAFGIPALINQNNPAAFAGGLLVAFSYAADVIDAPFSANRYNAKMDQTSTSFLNHSQKRNDFVVSFRF